MLEGCVDLAADDSPHAPQVGLCFWYGWSFDRCTEDVIVADVSFGLFVALDIKYLLACEGTS